MLRPKTDLTCFHLETSIELNAVTWLGNLAAHGNVRPPSHGARLRNVLARANSYVFPSLRCRVVFRVDGSRPVGLQGIDEPCLATVNYP